jgi:hypothetical protein
MGDNDSTAPDFYSETASETNCGTDRDLAQQKAVIDALRAGDLAEAERAISSHESYIQSPLATPDPSGHTLLDFLFSRPMQSYPNIAFSSKIASMLIKQGVRLRVSLLLNMIENGYIAFTPYLLSAVQHDERMELLTYSKPGKHKCAFSLAGESEDSSVFWCYAGLSDIIYQTLSARLARNSPVLISSQVRSQHTDAQNLFPDDINAAIIYLLIQSKAIEKYAEVLVHVIKHASTKTLTHALPEALGRSFPVLLMRSGIGHLDATYQVLDAYFNRLNLSGNDDSCSSSKQKATSSIQIEELSIEQADEISLAAYQLKDYQIMRLITQHIGIEFDWMLSDDLPFSIEQRKHLVGLNTWLSHKNLCQEQRLALAKKAVQIFKAKMDVKKSYQELQALLVVQQTLTSNIHDQNLQTGTLHCIIAQLSQRIASIDYQLTQTNNNGDLSFQLIQERQACAATKHQYLVCSQTHYGIQQGIALESLAIDQRIIQKQAELEAEKAHLASIDNPTVAQSSVGL